MEKGHVRPPRLPEARWGSSERPHSARASTARPNGGSLKKNSNERIRPRTSRGHREPRSAKSPRNTLVKKLKSAFSRPRFKPSWITARVSSTDTEDGRVLTPQTSMAELLERPMGVLDALSLSEEFTDWSEDASCPSTGSDDVASSLTSMVMTERAYAFENWRASAGSFTTFTAQQRLGASKSVPDLPAQLNSHSYGCLDMRLQRSDSFGQICLNGQGLERSHLVLKMAIRSCSLYGKRCVAMNAMDCIFYGKGAVVFGSRNTIHGEEAIVIGNDTEFHIENFTVRGSGNVFIRGDSRVPIDCGSLLDPKTTIVGTGGKLKVPLHCPLARKGVDAKQQVPRGAVKVH